MGPPPGIVPVAAAAPGGRSLANLPRARAMPAAAGSVPADPALSAVMRSLEAQSLALASLVNSGQAPGLDLGSEDAGGPRLGGARGAAALEQWRRHLTSQPEAVVERIRRNRNQALGGAAGLPGPTATMRSYLSSEVPFGNARTAAYLMFGLADVCDLMEAGQWHLAEAHANLLIASGEQAALQSWQWPLAWLLTQLPEPAWARIRHQPQPETARPLSRLADQSLMAAVVTYYRDVSTVMEAQRKAAPGVPPGGGHANAGGDDPAAGKPKPKWKGKHQNQEKAPAAAAAPQ